MDYREEIVKALSKVFYSDCGQYYTAVACEFEPISLSCNIDFVADVDAAAAILNKHVWTFRTNNSDAAAKGLKIPPEIGVIQSLLGRCVRIFDRIKSEIYDDREAWRAWDARTSVFGMWEILIRQYYPPVASTPIKAAPKAEKRPSGRPQRTVEYFVLDDDKGGYIDYLRSELECLSINGDGKISAKDVGSLITLEIEEGRLRPDVSVKEFRREFGLKCSPQSICRYIPEKVRPKRNKRETDVNQEKQTEN